MAHHEDAFEHNTLTGGTALGFLAGLLIGSLAGASAALLMAPQSGQRTRAQIQRKGDELIEQATDTLEETVGQARESGRRISVSVQKQASKLKKQAGEMQQRGQDLIDGQKERWSPVVEAGHKAVNGTD